MTNGEKFKSEFGIYATELWAMPEEDFLKWLKAEPVKRGKWIKVDKHTVKCSECGNYLDMRGVNAGRGDANYCPNCGAKMDLTE